MPVPIAELFVSVGADTSGATAGLNALNSQLSKIGSGAAGGFNLTNVGKSIKSFGSQAKTVGYNLTTDLTAPILAIGGGAFAAGADFEHAFTQVKRTVDGLDETQLEALRQSLLDMATTPAGGLKTASELADIAAVGGQLGLTNDEIKSYTSLVARLSLATELPFGEIADDIGRSLKIMNIGEKDYERFGSTVAELGNVMGGTEADIFEFSRRMAATLTALGVTPEKILAISSALSEAGVNPEAGATAINKFFVEMVNSLNDASGASEETKQKLQSLKDTISDLSGSLEVAVLRQSEFGRNTPASVVKANQLAIAKYQRELGDANGKMNTFAQTSADGKLSIAGMAKVAGVGEDAFRALVATDPAQAFAQFVAGLQRITQEGGAPALTKALDDLGITDERAREALLALAASSKSLPNALNAANTAWTKQTSLIDEVNKAMTDLKNQITLTANTAQVAVIRAFDKQREAIQALIDQINNDLIPAFTKMSDAIPKLTPDQIKLFAGLAALGPAVIALGAALSILGAVITVLSSPLVLVAIGTLGGLALVFDQIANHWDTMKSVMDKIPQLAGFAFLIDSVKKHGDEIKQMLNDLVTIVQTWDFNKDLGAALLAAGAIFSAFGTFLSNFFDTVILPILLRFKGWIDEHILGAFIGLLEFLKTLGVTTLPGGVDVGSTIAQLKTAQTAATATAAGTGDVNVQINNPQVTSQALLDKLGQQVAAAVTTALVTAERSVVIAPQPLPGQVPGTPF